MRAWEGTSTETRAITESSVYSKVPSPPGVVMSHPSLVLGTRIERLRSGHSPPVLQLIEVSVQLIDIVYYLFYIPPGNGQRFWGEGTGQEQLLVTSRFQVPGLPLQQVFAVLQLNAPVHIHGVAQGPFLEGVEVALTEQPLMEG